MQADGSSRSACMAAPYSWPDSSSPESAWPLHLHPFNGMSRSSALNLRRRLPRSHPVRNHLLQQLSDRLNVTCSGESLCVPHLLRHDAPDHAGHYLKLFGNGRAQHESNRPSPHLTRLPHNCLNATPAVSSPPEPHETKDDLQPSLHATSAPVIEAPPDRHAQLPQMANPHACRRILSPQKCQDRHHNRPLSSPPLRLKRHRSFPSSSTTQALRKPDYGWLAGPLLQRIEALKQYPATARLHRLEGRVIVRIVIQQDGHITSATVARSSGHDVLDQAALETIRQASPLTLSQPLEKSSVTMQIPLGYYLDR
jgi:TonB family protein